MHLFDSDRPSGLVTQLRRSWSDRSQWRVYPNWGICDTCYSNQPGAVAHEGAKRPSKSFQHMKQLFSGQECVLLLNVFNRSFPQICQPYIRRSSFFIKGVVISKPAAHIIQMSHLAQQQDIVSSSGTAFTALLNCIALSDNPSSRELGHYVQQRTAQICAHLRQLSEGGGLSFSAVMRPLLQNWHAVYENWMENLPTAHGCGEKMGLATLVMQMIVNTMENMMDIAEANQYNPAAAAAAKRSRDAAEYDDGSSKMQRLRSGFYC